MLKRKKKVLVGLSGGVDSSVAARQLMEDGYQVIGAYIKIFPNWLERYYQTKNIACPWGADQRSARQTAGQLKIPFYIFDFSRDYDREVLADFLDQYRQGKTPNPDVLCNKFIKFGRLLTVAEKVGADYIATGHYARKIKNRIFRGKDKHKDQSYFLWALNCRQLNKSLFPLGNLTKPQVRARARQFGLSAADRPDSQGICFLGQIKVVDFLRFKIKTSQGKILTGDGEKIGFHFGAQFYTIGQRLRQANVSSLGTSFQGKNMPAWYIASKDMTKNELTVVRADDPQLFVLSLRARQVNWISGKFPAAVGSKKYPLKCQIRYGQAGQKCRLKRINNQTIQVDFQKPQRAVSPGQSIVVYQADELLGGGIIIGKQA